MEVIRLTSPMFFLSALMLCSVVCGESLLTNINETDLYSELDFKIPLNELHSLVVSEPPALLFPSSVSMNSIGGFDLDFYEDVFVRVDVDISTATNEIKLSSKELVVFGCRREVLLSWNCFVSRSHLVFVTRAKYVPRVLNSLIYIRHNPTGGDESDILRVRIYGGVGEDCLTKQEQFHFSGIDIVGDDCFVDTTTTILKSDPTAPNIEDGYESEMPPTVRKTLTALALLALLTCCVYSMTPCLVRSNDDYFKSVNSLRGQELRIPVAIDRA